MNDIRQSQNDVITSYKDAPTRAITAGGVEFAY